VLFAKNPSFTTKIPSRSDLEWDFRQFRLSQELSIDIYGAVCDNPLHKANNRIHEYRNGKGAAFSEMISPESAFAVFYVVTPVMRR
jgi:hypothetical protein